MGVGAIFIATLALDKLPKPNNPPQNQTDVLALTMEPIIAFMVMCSILTRTLSEQLYVSELTSFRRALYSILQFGTEGDFFNVTTNLVTSWPS